MDISSSIGVEIRDPQSLDLLRILVPHEALVTYIFFSPDSTRFLPRRNENSSQKENRRGDRNPPPFSPAFQESFSLDIPTRFPPLHSSLTEHTSFPDPLMEQC
jgi:hypothetical protein